ncbi:PQQ-dependent dehydrogenase, methanol/ethanol family [Sphingobium aquiterrae]|uniref:PQQ-dependent dehydrogenase, methanol/ethanol family n=1 Tax=Sphingobium aquiterrae TaxID=2038656 RepID=UPI0030198CDA
MSDAATAMLAGTDDGSNWPAYGRTYDESHYSPLTGITDANAARLKLAWYFDLPPSVSVASQPLAVGGTVYIATGLSVVRALDGKTGRLLWEYDPQVAQTGADVLRTGWGIRGLAWWDGRLFVGTQDGRLIAVDARTGRPVWTAQTTTPGDGRYITGAPRVFKGRVIIGHGGADYAHIRGYVSAYDTGTGKLLWRFYTVPGDPAKDKDQTTRLAAATWKGDYYKLGGGGTVWNAITYDPELDRIYIGTGNGGPWNQKIRSPGGGDNLFLCAIVALDAATGRYLWHYQTNPGETWDYNSAMDIGLATLPIGGRPRRVLLHAPKNGFFYVIDRDTGKLISAEPIAKVNWASRIDIASGRPVEDPQARYPGGSALVWPGPLGAHNWYPMAFDPKARRVFIPTSRLPGYYSDRKTDIKNWRPRPGVMNSGVDPLLEFDGVAPTGNLGALQAWDPATQRPLWEVPLPSPVNGGVMATAGNLVFQGRADGVFVAYAADSGKALWRFDAQNGVVASPISYRAGGKQYVTVIAGFGGGAGAMGALSAAYGWQYRTQMRRVLTFALDGAATLPKASASPSIRAIEDRGYRPALPQEAAGAALFAGSCAYCHGAGVIAGGGAPDLRTSSIVTDPSLFRSIVHDGALSLAGMPKFDNFSNPEREAIRQYIRSRAARLRGAKVEQ